LDGFVVLEWRVVHGEIELGVETTADRAWCRRCGVRALSKGRSTVVVRDVDAFGRRVRLRWRKRRWRCREQRCAAKTWTETSEAIAPRAVLTRRARVDACRRVGRDAHSVAAVARDLGVGWHTVMAAVVEVGPPLVDDPGPHRRCACPGRGRDVVPARVSRAAQPVRDRAGRSAPQPPARRRRRTRRQRGDLLVRHRDDSWLAAVGRVALDSCRG
jgi:hypothetical protein